MTRTCCQEWHSRTFPQKPPLPSPLLKSGASTHYRYTAGTNGLVYQQWVSPLPALTATEQQHLPLVTALMPEVGVGDLNYLDTQERHSATVGSLSASVSSRAHRDNEQTATAFLCCLPRPSPIDCSPSWS